MRERGVLGRNFIINQQKCLNTPQVLASYFWVVAFVRGFSKFKAKSAQHISEPQKSK